MSALPRAQVTVVCGPSAGSTIEVGEKLTLGRHPQNRLCLRDETVSRHHALIERRDDRFLLRDLGSASGTYVDRKLVQTEAELTPDAEIAIGGTILRFRRVDGLTPIATLSMRRPAGILRSFSNWGEQLPIPSTEQSDGNLTFVSLDESSFPESSDELARASRHLKTLVTVNSLIATELDQEKLFERILDALESAFDAHRAAILTCENDRLMLRATRHYRGSHSEQVSSSIAYRALRDRIGVLTLDAGADERFDSRQSIVDGNIRSAICAPMVHHGEALGVIYLDTLGIARAFKEDQLKLLTAIAGPAGGAIRNARLVSRLKDTAVDTIFRLAVAAEYRDDDTGFHIHRMSDYAEAIARSLALEADFCELIKIASPMHDVGKIGIPDSILKKPGKLTKREFAVMREHPAKGGAILANAQSELLQMAHNIALTHHEKFDGSGYPGGLQGDTIPIEGRIVAVADVFDALMSKRCYKPAFELQECLRIIEESSGGHFDPAVVKAFFAAKDELLSIRDHYSQLEAEAAETGRQMSATELLLRRPAV